MSEFEPTNDLEASLVRAATDPAARPDFYREVLRSKLFVLTPHVGEGEAVKGRTMTLVSWQGPAGRATPIFTSRERVEAVIAQMTEPLDAAINPGLPYSKQFTSDEMRRMVNGAIFEASETIAVHEPTKVLLGQPAVYPQQLVDALVRLFRGRVSVERAYLALVHYANEPEPHLVVGVLSSNQGEDVRDAGLVVNEVGVGRVDFVDMADSAETIPKYLRESTKPFYVRSSATGA